MKCRRLVQMSCVLCLALSVLLSLPANATDSRSLNSKSAQAIALEERINAINTNPNQEFVGVLYFSAEDTRETDSTSLQFESFVGAEQWNTLDSEPGLDHVAVPIWFDKISNRTVKFYAEVLLTDIIDTFELTLDYDDGTTGYAYIDITGQYLCGTVLEFDNKTYASPGRYDVWPINGELVCSAGVRVYEYDRFICTEATVNIT